MMTNIKSADAFYLFFSLLKNIFHPINMTWLFSDLSENYSSENCFLSETVQKVQTSQGFQTPEKRNMFRAYLGKQSDQL